MSEDLLHNLSLGVMFTAIGASALVILGGSIYDVAYTFKRRSLAVLKPAKRNTKRPLISVIVYNYKQPQKVIECMSSLVRSTHRKLQIIVVDNASKDASAAEIREFIAGHPKKDIKLIAKRKHAPLGDVISAALKSANGDLVVALEANHAVDKKALQTAANYMGLNDVEALVPAVLLKQELSVLNLLARYKNFASLSKQKTFSLLSNQGSSFRFGIFYRLPALKAKSMNASGVYTSDVTLYYSHLPRISETGSSSSSSFRLITKKTAEGPNPLLGLAKLIRMIAVVLVLPAFLWYSLYLALNSRYPDLLVASWALYSLFMVLSIWAIEQLGIVQKIKYSLLAPAIFSLFVVNAYIESIAIIIKPLRQLALILKNRFRLNLELLKQRELPAKAGKPAA